MNSPKSLSPVVDMILNVILVIYHCYYMCVVLPWALESWAGYDIRVFGEEPILFKYTNKEHALVTLNHRGDLDWMIGWVISDRMGVLGVSIHVARWSCTGPTDVGTV